MRTETITITPAMAADWLLNRNIGNRPLSQYNVKRIAGALKSGAWSLNGEAIKFDAAGRLVDGQHRLKACVLAGVPFQTLVVHGLGAEAFDTIDQGKPRSCGDVLARHGERHYNLLTASLRIVYSIQTWGQVSDSFSLRPDEIKKCLEENQGIRDAVAKTASSYNKGLLRTSVIAALLYLFRQKNIPNNFDYVTPVADQFWDKVVFGEKLFREMPEYQLRQRLEHDSRSRAKLRSSNLVALAIKAWNFSLEDRRIKRLSYSEGEEFPIIQPEESAREALMASRRERHIKRWGN